MKIDIMPQNVHFLYLADFSNNVYFGTLKLKHLGQIPTNLNCVHFLFFWFPGLQAFFSSWYLKLLHTSYKSPQCAKLPCDNINCKHKCTKSYTVCVTFYILQLYMLVSLDIVWNLTTTKKAMCNCEFGSFRVWKKVKKVRWFDICIWYPLSLLVWNWTKCQGQFYIFYLDSVH